MLKCSCNVRQHRVNSADTVAWNLSNEYRTSGNGCIKRVYGKKPYTLLLLKGSHLHYNLQRRSLLS